MRNGVFAPERESLLASFRYKHRIELVKDAFENFCDEGQYSYVLVVGPMTLMQVASCNELGGQWPIKSTKPKSLHSI